MIPNFEFFCRQSKQEKNTYQNAFCPLRDQSCNHVDKQSKNQDKTTSAGHQLRRAEYQIFVKKLKKMY